LAITLTQKAAALALAEQHRVLIPKTVVLETEWVLRSRYGLRPTEILGFLSFPKNKSVTFFLSQTQDSIRVSG